MDNSLRDKILDRCDLVEIIGERVSLTRRGKEFVALCPFHDDSKPSLNVNPDKQIFKCFACGAGGDVFSFVQKYERVDFRTALERLAERAGIDLSARDERSGDRRSQRDALRRVTAWAAEHFRRNLHQTAAGKSALEYARRRQLSDDTIERFGLGLAADAWDDLLRAARKVGVQSQLLQDTGLVTTNDRGKTYDRFRNRLIFPIYSHGAAGDAIAFGGRTLGDDPAKYLNSPETPLFNKSRVLYGFTHARDAILRQRQVVVVEGYMDAVMMHQAGIENTVATLGTALTDAHVKLLGPLADDIVLCFDGDDAGRRAADRGVETAVKHGVRVRVAVLPDGQDPADLVLAEGPEAFARTLTNAIDALQFKWDQVVEALRSGAFRSRHEAVSSYLQLVARAAARGGIDPIALGLLARQLSDLTGVATDAVHDAVRRESARLQEVESTQLAAPATVDAYRTEVAGLPAGLVTATEAVLSAVISDVDCFDRLDQHFAKAVAYAESWQQVSDCVRLAADEVGRYTRRDVLERCDDSQTLVLMDRLLMNFDVGRSVAGDFEVVYRRLVDELEEIHAREARERLRSGGINAVERKAGFAALVAARKQRAGFLPGR